MDNLQCLFDPKSVAVVGASANPRKWGNWIAEQVIRHKDNREIYFVSSTCEKIYEHATLKSIGELRRQLDLGIICLPVPLFEGVVDELLEKETKVIIGITTGFAERDNLELELRIANKVREAGSRFLGPNCAGVWDSYSPFHCLPIAEFSPGPVGLISQSGGIITDIGVRLQEVGLGFSRIASIGNQSDILIEDLILNFDQDDNTKVIAIYAEHEANIPFHIIRKTSKPVVLLMPDGTPAARRAALHHTNSKLYTNAYTKTSMALNFGFFAESIRDFVAQIQLALSGQPSAGKRIVIATDTGGLGIMAAAAVEKAKLTVDECSQELKEQIRSNVRLPQAVVCNPIDMINTKSGFSKTTVDMMKVLQAAPEVDAIVMILFLIENAIFNPEEEREHGLQLAAEVRLGNKPVLFVCKTFTSPGTLALLEQRMPVYRDVETAVAILEVLCG